MIDASKFPKTARLQQQREAKYEAEQLRLKKQKLADSKMAKAKKKQTNNGE